MGPTSPYAQPADLMFPSVAVLFQGLLNIAVNRQVSPFVSLLMADII